MHSNATDVDQMRRCVVNEAVMRSREHQCIAMSRQPSQQAVMESQEEMDDIVVGRSPDLRREQEHDYRHRSEARDQ